MGNPCVCKERPSSRWVFHAPKPFCLSPLCCLGYISWWDVRPTWIGTFFAHMRTRTHRYSCSNKHMRTCTPPRTQARLPSAKTGLQCTKTGHYLCNYWFWSDFEVSNTWKAKEPKINRKDFSFTHTEGFFFLLSRFLLNTRSCCFFLVGNPSKNYWNLIILSLEYCE